MQDYRIIDLKGDVINPKEITVRAPSPEDASKVAFGVDLVRSGQRTICAHGPQSNPRPAALDRPPLYQSSEAAVTPAQADQRIMLSCKNLTRYVALAATSVEPMPDTIVLVSEEMAILEAIAEEYPGKVRQLVVLATEWIAFREGMQKKLH